MWREEDVEGGGCGGRRMWRWREEDVEGKDVEGGEGGCGGRRVKDEEGGGC